ncbi:hypothetical protein HK405_005811 [Cladochytrium tenue]|nr:hypothetical protein HK405_005811 [Cladochytrium tenue]
MDALRYFTKEIVFDSYLIGLEQIKAGLGLLQYAFLGPRALKQATRVLGVNHEPGPGGRHAVTAYCGFAVAVRTSRVQVSHAGRTQHVEHLRPGSVVGPQRAGRPEHDLVSVVTARQPGPRGEREKLEIEFSDFDGVSYSISNIDTPHVLVFSMSMRCYAELRAYGADAVLAREYGSMLQRTPRPGYDVTLLVDLTQIHEDPEVLVKKLSLLKRNAMAAPFEAAFATQAAGSAGDLMTVHYRDEEAIFIQAQPDRVTVIFSTVFKEETDQILGRVFLQEFVDARRQPGIQNAPQVLYSPREPPLELRGVRGLADGEGVGYVTFVLFPRHFVEGTVREETIARIQLFRDYLHYHIKASKSYMHSRMRTRVESFLKVLNRAKPEKPDELKEKKTASNTRVATVVGGDDGFDDHIAAHADVIVALYH